MQCDTQVPILKECFAFKINKNQTTLLLPLDENVDILDAPRDSFY